MCLTGWELGLSFRQLSKRTMEHVVAISRALSDPNRIRIVALLRDGQLCVCQIRAVLGLAMSTVSRHVAILTHAGLVTGRRHGRWMYYMINPRPSAVARAAMKWLEQYISEDRVILKDRHTLQRVLSMDKEQLCPRPKGR